MSNFNDLPWHDAELIDIHINRRDDFLSISVCWPEDEGREDLRG